jgi:hypothetical protein
VAGSPQSSPRVTGATWFRWLAAVARWVARYPAVCLTLVAGIAATDAWAALSNFYLPFGVSPQETGVAAVFQTVIAGVVVATVDLLGILVITAIALTVVGVGSVVAIDCVRVLRASRRDDVHLAVGVRRRRERFSSWATGAAELVALMVAVVFAAMLYLLPDAAKADAARASHGNPVAGVTAGPFPALAYHALPVTVSRAPTPIPDGDCILLLGSNDGTTILADVSSGETLRLPSASVDTALPTSGTTPACRQLAESRPSPPRASLDSYRTVGGAVSGAAGAACLAAALLLLVRVRRLRSLRRPIAGLATAATLGFAGAVLGISMLGAAAALIAGAPWFVATVAFLFGLSVAVATYDLYQRA